MSGKAIVALLVSGIFAAASSGQTPPAAPPVTAPTPGIAGVVRSGTPIEVVASGFRLGKRNWRA